MSLKQKPKAKNTFRVKGTERSVSFDKQKPSSRFHTWVCAVKVIQRGR